MKKTLIQYNWGGIISLSLAFLASLLLGEYQLLGWFGITIAILLVAQVIMISKLPDDNHDHEPQGPDLDRVQCKRCKSTRGLMIGYKYDHVLGGATSTENRLRKYGQYNKEIIGIFWCVDCGNEFEEKGTITFNNLE